MEVRRVHGFLIDHVEVMSIGFFHLGGLDVGNGRGRELGVHDLERVTHHIVRLGQRAERGQYLVVYALRQQHLVKRVLESVTCLVRMEVVCVIWVVYIC